MSMEHKYSRFTGIKVARGYGETFRKALVDLALIDHERKIRSDDSSVYLPVLEMDESRALLLRDVGDFELVDIEFPPEKIRPDVQDILGISPHFDLVGDIAIVEPDSGLEVGPALIKCYKNIKVVVAPLSAVEGEYRTRRFRHLAGEKRTFTVHREHGLRYRIDLEKAYFSTRLGTERLRVAEQITPSDVAFDMFAGVGPFALLMAKRGARVVAVEKNPDAAEYLRGNAILNKLENVEIIEGDSAEIAFSYENQADHVVMNLPHSAREFLIPAITSAKSGGVIHYYSISKESDLYSGDIQLIEKACRKKGVGFDVVSKKVVRSYAPRQYNIVIDFIAIKGPS